MRLDMEGETKFHKSLDNALPPFKQFTFLIGEQKKIIYVTNVAFAGQFAFDKMIERVEVTIRPELAGEVADWDPGGITPRGLASLLFLIVLGTAVAFVAYTWLLRVTTPALAGSSSFVNPIVAVALGWLVQDGTTTTGMLVAAPLVIAAVALSREPARRDRGRSAAAGNGALGGIVNVAANGTLGGSGTVAVYLGVAGMQLTIGCTMLLVGLHNAVARQQRVHGVLKVSNRRPHDRRLAKGHRLHHVRPAEVGEGAPHHDHIGQRVRLAQFADRVEKEAT
jgi:hypothetical protein